MMNLRKPCPENYYSEMTVVEQSLRKPTALCKSLMPIPATDLYRDIIKKHHNNNQIFAEELEVWLHNFFIDTTLHNTS